MARIINVEGIGPVYAGKLQQAGIWTTETLLDAGKTPKGREALEEMTGISGKLILEWVNLADVFRIKGIGEEYSDLLEEAGVDTVPELAQRIPVNLYQKLGETNAEKKLVRRLPSQGQVAEGGDQDKALDRVITY